MHPKTLQKSIQKTREPLVQWRLQLLPWMSKTRQFQNPPSSSPLHPKVSIGIPWCWRRHHLELPLYLPFVALHSWPWLVASLVGNIHLLEHLQRPQVQAMHQCPTGVAVWVSTGCGVERSAPHLRYSLGHLQSADTQEHYSFLDPGVESMLE